MNQPLLALLAWRVLWVAPCSAVGLVASLFVLLTGGSVRKVGHALECAVYPNECTPHSMLRRLPFAAITLGHVIVGVSHAELARLREHELVHVRQYEKLGVLFFVAYPLASLVAWLSGRCPYRGNRYEVQAFDHVAVHDDAA